MTLQITENLELGGSYRLTRRLGQGGMGEVWEAEHLRLPKKVAVKFLLMQGEIEAEWLSRFRREAEIASQLHHPNIIEVHDFNISDVGVPYIVMELLRGEDLRARLAAGPLSLAEAKVITRQVVSALSLAHQQGIIHRDLKPENIFLSADPDGQVRAKILDFGISKLQGQNVTFQTREHSLLGTPGYMSPEQAMGKHAALDGRADLFALATIFYEMLTGQTIFRGDSLAEVVFKVVNHMPEPLNHVSPKVPASVAEAVARALAKDPAERQPSVAEFGAALEADRSLAETLVSVPSPPPHGAEHEGSSAPTATEAPASASAPTHRADAGKGLSLLAGAVLAVAVAIGVSLFVLRSPGLPAPIGESPSQAAVPPSPKVWLPQETRPIAATGTHAEAAQGQQGQDGGKGTPSREDSRSSQDNRQPDGPTPKQKAVTPRVSDEVRKVLRQAHAALSAGDTERALALARRSMRDEPTAEAYEIMARAYCAARDLGMAKAILRNLSGAKKRKAIAACRQAGLSL